MKKRCAFLSMDNLDEFECYDYLLFEPLKKRGWSVEEVSWRDQQIDWNQFDVVIIRSPWDYQQDPEAFLDTLHKIDQSTAHLENSLELVKWNVDKTYLRDLQESGIEIVPSMWRESFAEAEMMDFFGELGTNEIIIKPTVSANADDTFRIKKAESDDYLKKLKSIFQKRPFIIQPFMNNITEEGEFSVFFFGDTYSHTILKIPAAADFRVQEEHGGRLKAIKDPEPTLLDSARQLLNTLDSPPLYSRMDYVRTAKNSFALMELELIEPSLYFNMDKKSPERFAEVFDRRMQKQLQGTGQGTSM